MPVTAGMTMAGLRAALTDLWLEMTVGVVAAGLAGSIPPAVAQTALFPLRKSITDPDVLAAVEALVQQGRPWALFERWRGLGDARLALPPDLIHDPYSKST
jgi:hypothetical protein